MCGFSMIYSFNSEKIEDKIKIDFTNKSTKYLQPRGPNEFKYYDGENFS